MGRFYPKNLTDLIRVEAQLRVTCPSCGRTALFDPKQIISYYRAHGWNTAWEIAGMHFHCSGNDRGLGCGGRGARLSWEPWPMARTRPAPPQPRS
jgi:hypothetical protein